MADDIYAKFGDIEGESTDKKYAGYSSLDAISHDLFNQSSGDRSTGGGGSKSVATHGEISFTKQFDASSAGLLKACLQGETFDKVHIAICRRSGNDKQEFLTYELTDAYISALGHDTRGVDGAVIETGAINYGTIKWTYDKTDSKGKSQGKMEASWNRLDNTEKV